MTVHITSPSPSLPPPASSVGAVGWMRQNLFSSPLNSIFTLAGFYLIYSLSATSN